MMQVGDRIDRDNFAGVNDDDLAARLLDFREDVRAEDDRVIAREACDELAGFALLFRIEAGCGLVKNQHRRIVNDGLRDADALAITFRQLADDRFPHAAQSGAFEHFIDALRYVGAGDTFSFATKVR